MFLSALAASFVRNIHGLAVSIGFMGLGSGCLRIRSVAVASQLFSAEKRSLALSFATIGTPLGAALLPLLWRYLLDNFTIYQVTFLLAAMISHLFIASLLMQGQFCKLEHEASKANNLTHYDNLILNHA